MFPFFPPSHVHFHFYRLWRAKRLFMFAAKGERFPEQDFRTRINPWLETELSEREGSDGCWEGTGCWHPVFPARADDCWLWAAVAAKFIASVVTVDFAGSRFIVYEQCIESGIFTGVEKKEDTRL